ncbi:MAG: single-stranded DNA-binding protein [Deltaproteobacteria bacterium]|nr:single-stranded DNA-binding protein [Deltaproteobacteria bacterium]
MASLNKVMLIGYLGDDPEIRYTPSGSAVANFRIATTEQWTNKEGEKQERTEWHKIVAWRKLGETCGEYLHKGSLVYIEGGLQTRSWEDRDGNKRWTTEIIAWRMQMLDRAGKSGEAVSVEERFPTEEPVEATPTADPEAPEDDIPF